MLTERIDLKQKPKTVSLAKKTQHSPEAEEKVIKNISSAGHTVKQNVPEHIAEKITAERFVADRKQDRRRRLNEQRQQAPVVQEKTATQKRDEAQQLYDAYIQSDEYKQNLVNNMKDQTDEWMNATLYGSEGYTPAPRKDQKEQELKALVDHYTAQAQKEEDQATLGAALQELETWDETDRKALEAYWVQDTWERQHPMADPLTGGSRQVSGEIAAPLFAKYGEAKVRKLAEALEWQQSAELAEQTQAKGREAAGEGFFDNMGADALSILEKGVGNLTGPLGYVTELGRRTGQFSTLNPNNIGQLPNVHGDAIQGQKAENLAADGGKLDTYLYQGGMSAADSGLRLLMGGGAAGGAVLSATGSFARTVSEASSQGATPGEAAALGIVNAGIEYATEKVPLDKLMDAAKAGGHGWKEILKNALIQGGIEAGEEELSLIGTTLAEAAILREKSGYQQRIQELVASGMNLKDAQNAAFGELMQEAKETAIVSFFSGGLSEAGASVAGNLTHRAADRAEDAAEMQQTEENAAENAAPVKGAPEAAVTPEEAAEQLGRESPKAEPVQKTEGELGIDRAYEATVGTERDQEAALTAQTNAISNPLDSYPTEKQNSIRSYIRSVDESVKGFVQQVKSGDKTFRRQKIADVNDRAAKDIGDILGIDAGGYTHNINTNGVRHILNRHGENGEHDSSMAVDDDIARIGWVLENYDSAEAATDNGKQVYSTEFRDSNDNPAPQIRFIKKIDGTYYVVEAACENKYKKLWVQSAYLQKNNGDVTQASAADPSANHEKDARSALASPSPDNSVPQNGPEVNGNIDESRAQGVDGQEQSMEGGQPEIKGTGAAERNFAGMQQYEDLISDDNIQRTRATDARQEEILKTDSYGRQVTEFAGNVGNSEAISDRDVDTLKQMIQEGLLGHDTQSMTEVHGHAVEKIKKKGAANVRDEITRAVANGKINEHLIAEAEVLFAQYSNRRNMQADASTMLLNLAQMATQSGRQLNMFKLMRRLTPEGQLMVVRKNVDRAVESINESRGKKKQADVAISEELEGAYIDAARDTLSDEAAVESTVAHTIEEGMNEDAEAAAETALAVIHFSDLPAIADTKTKDAATRNTGLAEQKQGGELDIPWGEIHQDDPSRREPNIQTNDMNERIGQRVADSLTRQARQQERSVEDVLYSEIMRFANDKATQGRQQQEKSAQTPNLEAMRDYYRYRPFFQNAWDIARDRVEQAMFSMQDGDPRIQVIEQFLASGDELLGVENWNPIGAMDYANPQSTVRRGAKEAATAAGIRMDNRSTQNREQVRQQMRDVLIENARNKEAAAQRIAQIAVESMGLEGQAAEAMAADVTRAFYNDLAQQSARRVAQMFGTDRKQQQKVQKSMSDRLAELYNMGAFSDEQYRQAAFDSIFGEGSGITIDDRLLETFVNAAGERRDQAADAIYKFAAAQIKPTLGEQWDAWRNLAMLGNPKTHIRNIFGSAVFRPYVSAKRAVGAGIERLTLDRENRTKAVLGVSKNSRDLLTWAKADAKSKAAQDAMELSGTTGNDVRSAVEDARQILPGKLDTVRKKNMEAMEGADMFFKRTEYASSLASFLKARGYSAKDLQEGKVPASVLEAGRSLAVKEAQKATFNDRNRFSDTMAKFRVKGSNPTAKALNAIAKGIMPFTRTPANIAVRAVEYSPAGLARGFKEIHDAVKNGEGTVADGIDHIASGLTGTGAMALGAALAAGLIPNVRLVGKIEDEDELPEGATEYSIQFGNDFYSISWLAPANIPLFIGANVYNAFRNREEKGELDAWDVLSSLVETGSDIIDPMLELSCVSSLVDAVENMAYEEGAGNKFLSLVASAATSYFTQGLPTILGQAEQATETTKMTTFSNADNTVQRAVERTLGNATKRIPGVDLYQTEKRDEFGEEVRNDGGWMQRTVDAFLNPFTKSTVKDDKLTREIARLNGILPESVSPPEIPKKITYTGSDGTQHKDHRLTEQEYSTMAAVQGQTAKGILDEFLKSDTYAAMTAQQKTDALKYVDDYAREKGRTEAVEGYEGMSEWMLGIEGNAAEAIINRTVEAAFSDAFSLTDRDPAAAAEALDQAYSLLDPNGRLAWAQEAGSKEEAFIMAKARKIDTQTFTGLYQQYKDIGKDESLDNSQKAQEWADVLQKAQEAGDLTKAQKEGLKKDLIFYNQIPASSAKYDTMTNQGMDSDSADYIVGLLDGIEATADKLDKIAGAKLPEEQKDIAMKAWMDDYDPKAKKPNYTEVKYDYIRQELGYSATEYSAAKRLYSSDGTKEAKIDRIEDKLGITDAQARELYGILDGNKNAMLKDWAEELYG